MIKRLISVLLTCTIFVLCFSISAFSADNATAVSWDGKVFSFVPSPKEDLFQNFKKLMPGDERHQVVNLNNSSSNPVKFYLEILAADQEYSGEKLELIWNLIYRYIDVIIVDINGAPVYEGVIGGQDNQTRIAEKKTDGSFFLGEIPANSFDKITVDLKIDPNLSDEYQNMIGHVIWRFRVEWDDGSSEAKSETITIEDKTPLGKLDYNQDGKVTVEDITALGTEIVNTGDTTIIFIWVVAVVLIPFIIFIIAKKRRQEERT